MSLLDIRGHPGLALSSSFSSPYGCPVMPQSLSFLQPIASPIRSLNSHSLCSPVSRGDRRKDPHGLWALVPRPLGFFPCVGHLPATWDDAWVMLTMT